MSEGSPFHCERQSECKIRGPLGALHDAVGQARIEASILQSERDEARTRAHTAEYQVGLLSDALDAMRRSEETHRHGDGTGR